MQATSDFVSSSITEPARAIGSGILPELKRWYASHGAQLGYGLTALALLVGWFGREERHIRADAGLGYWLGIVGASMMALLLLYPLRKRIRFLQCMGATSYWFQAHMILGVLGPAFILYHCNFQLGSLNSQVALFCTLLVAASGLVGRYLYAKIHVGLYGHKASLELLVARARLTAEEKTFASAFVPTLLERMSEYDKEVLRPPRNVLASAVLPLVLTLKTRWAKFTLLRFARSQIKLQAAKSERVAAQKRHIETVICKFITEHMRRVRRVAAFCFYERLFSMWHVFHLPFFFILVLAALAHVLAVHMY